MGESWCIKSDAAFRTLLQQNFGLGNAYYYRAYNINVLHIFSLRTYDSRQCCIFYALAASLDKLLANYLGTAATSTTALQVVRFGIRCCDVRLMGEPDISPPGDVLRYYTIAYVHYHPAYL